VSRQAAYGRSGHLEFAPNATMLSLTGEMLIMLRNLFDTLS